MKGIGVSEGIAIGRIEKFLQHTPEIENLQITDIKAEIEKLEAAIEKTKQGIRKILEEKASLLGEKNAEIFYAHLEILEDPSFIEPVYEKIEKEMFSAAYAVKIVAEDIIQMFEALENEYLKERAADIKDVTSQLILHIQGEEKAFFYNKMTDCILVTHDLTPSDTVKMDLAHIKGIISEIGSHTSHSAILAKNLGIPAVMGVADALSVLKDGQMIILNGTNGSVIVNPDEEELQYYKDRIKKQETEREEWNQFCNSKTITMDGHEILLGANIGGMEDLENAIQSGAECIGLFRTEFLFMDQKTMPQEEYQYQIYKKVLSAMSPKIVVVRTLDIGGDKTLEYFPMELESNPFLGNRAIRLCLSHKDVFKIQLRALLRASIYGELHIMFPMIGTMEELIEAKKILKESQEELVKEGHTVSDNYKVGIMIETPAAALNADCLAGEADFFSIGTNDLVQYTFAADRMNQAVSYLYQPAHPSILRMIKLVVDAAHKNQITVGVCGEAASDGEIQKILIGLGVDELSMNPSLILKSRSGIYNTKYADLEMISTQALKQGSSKDVMELLHQEK